MNDINNKQSYKGAGNMASNVTNRITGRARFPFAMLFESKEFYNFALANKVNLFTSNKLPGFLDKFIEQNPEDVTSNGDVETSLIYLKPNLSTEGGFEEIKTKGRDRENVIDGDYDSLAVTLRSFLELQKELPNEEDPLDFIPEQVPDKVKKLRHFIYESGILNKRDIKYILNLNLLSQESTQDRLDMILASSTIAAVNGEMPTDSQQESSLNRVDSKFVFWEKKDDSDGELVRFTFAECITYLLTYIEFYIFFPEGRKWEYSLSAQEGFRMNFTMPYWRDFDSNNEGKENSGSRLKRRFHIFKLFYNEFMQRLEDIQLNMQRRTEIQALSTQKFSDRIKAIYREVAYDMYQSYTTRFPPAVEPDEDLMPLPEIEGEKEENVTCGAEYKSKFDAVKSQIQGDRIWWGVTNENEERTLIGKPSDYLICINGDGTLNYRGRPYRDYIESLNLEDSEYNDAKSISHVITSEGEIFGFNNYLRNKQYCSQEYLTKRMNINTEAQLIREHRIRPGQKCDEDDGPELCCVTHGMLGKLLLEHNNINRDTGMISAGEIHLDRDFKITGVNNQSGTFFPRPNHFSNENAILVFKTHLNDDIPNFYEENFDMTQDQLVRRNIEGGIGPLTDDDSSDEDQEPPVNPLLPPPGGSTELDEIKTPESTSTGSTEPEDGNTSSSSNRNERNATTNPEEQDDSSKTSDGQDDSNQTPQGSDSGSGSGSGDGNQHPAQPFLEANRLDLGRIRSDGDCLFVALLRVLRYDQQEINNGVISQFRSDIVDYITTDNSIKERQWSMDGFTGTSQVNFWFMYGESILAQPSSRPNSGRMYADIDDYKSAMKSTEANPEKPAGRFGTIFEIMAFREMFSRDLINLYGSDEIQVLKLDINNDLKLYTPPSSEPLDLEQVNFNLPILLYNRTHYDIAEPLPDVISQSGSKTSGPAIANPGSKKHDDDDDLVVVPEMKEDTTNTNKGLMRYVETIFSKNIGEEEQAEIDELTRLIRSI